MRDFSGVANFAFRNRLKLHISIVFISILMIPGLLQTLTPIDVDSYDMDSPEMVAEIVIDEEFSSKEMTVGFVVTIRDPSHVENGSQAPHINADGNPDRLVFPTPQEAATFQGEGKGMSGENIPKGGVFNLTFLRELQQKIMIARDDPLAEFYRPIVSELTGESANGTLSLYEQFEAFMDNRSLLTRPSFDPFGNIVPPLTNWDDCGELECLKFDDENVTQAHIDLAANRMILATPSTFMRWTTTDRAFIPDSDSPVIGPYGGQLGEDGSFQNAVWMPGRWSASATWILIQLDKEDMISSGYTFVWGDARSEPDSMTWDGLELYATPKTITPDDCLESVESGDGPCSASWALLSLEHKIRVTDQESITIIAPPTGINIEVNRELQQSVLLLATMFLCILVLLWASLRRISDVAIVIMTLGFSLLWMQGLIGWGMIFGNTINLKIISRSQFSNLLPILILALGIDDSLHALHRYKEERNGGKSTDEAVHISLSRVGRAIMLISLTTIAAFSANLISSIPALRSFGIEAALGVASAFVLTGLWAPLIRYDIDNWMQKRDRLKEDPENKLYLVPKHWLSRLSGGSAWAAPGIIILAIIITSIATPLMLALEGDFKVEDFIDEESEIAQSVFLINERFSSEGEPALILIEGDILDPNVYAAIGELRLNMNTPSPEDPNRYTTLPTGQIELHGIDELVYWTIGSMMANSTPFEMGGWDESLPDRGVGCETINGIPDTSSRGCLQFLYGFLMTHGIPSAGIIPEIPPSISQLYISPDCNLNPNATHLCSDGNTPQYSRMTMRWGIIRPEQFTMTELTLQEVELDMSPFENLSKGDMRIRSSLDSATEEYPVTWAIPTGSPVTRYVAATSMQDELQGTLILGVFFCLITLWWGFRPDKDERRLQRRKGFETRAIMVAFCLGVFLAGLYGETIGGICGLIVFLMVFMFGERALGLAMITTFPILVVVVWLYGMISAAGYGLNMVTVAIAAMSLGVGIDYVIHVIERYREEREMGRSVHSSLVAMGGASGLALVGSAISDITGFAIISFSSMGFFSAFGLFCALMIGLSFIASMIITSSILGLFAWREIQNDVKQVGGIRQLQLEAEKRLGIS